MMDTTEVFRPLTDNERITAPDRTHSGDEWTPITPVPADAPSLTEAAMRQFAKPGYAFTAHWRYNDKFGNLLGYTVRFDRHANGKPAHKCFGAITYCEGPGGLREWRMKSWTVPRPLYGLDRLTSRMDAPVLVVEGEKTADAAQNIFKDRVVVTSPGGSGAADKADWSPLKGRRVTIWPDHDEPGKKYAEAVNLKLDAAGIVCAPDTFPKGWDLADSIPDGYTSDNVTAMMEEAKPSPHSPLPLFPKLPASEPFPVEELGAVLGPAAKAIANKVQVPPAIAGQSVLAAAALAAQAHADVKLPYGQTRPLSLFFITVAGSGDRKTTSDNEALSPIHDREKALKADHQAEYNEWSVNAAAHSAARKKIERSTEFSYEGQRAALKALGPAPEKPLFPFLTAGDPTIEGLLKAWTTAPASLGVFSSEGGQLIGGYGMSSDNRLKSAAGYSELWDGRAVKRIRSLDGAHFLYGRRLSIHLMVQREVADEFLGDPALRDQGLLSRFLVAMPDSIAGKRLYREVSQEDETAIQNYRTRIRAVLEAPWPLAPEKRNELEPRVLTISDDAKADWCDFHDHIELQCGPGNRLDPIQDFAAKASEHAARIAGVLTIFENCCATEIGKAAMRSAIKLVDWYVNEIMRLRKADRVDRKLVVAQQLLDWIRQHPHGDVGVREILQYGPAAVRTKAEADKALEVLKAHNFIEEVSVRPRIIRLKRAS